MDRKTVVVLEDNSYVAEVYRQIVRSVDPTIEVVVASNALKAIDAVARYRPERLIVDIDLPGLNGVQFLNIISRDPVWSQIPAVVVTELSTEELAGLGKLPRGVRVLSKFGDQIGKLQKFLSFHSSPDLKRKYSRDPGYANPEQDYAEFLDWFRQTLSCRSDRALANLIGVSAGTLSKIRKGTLAPSANIILRLHQCSGVNVEQIRRLLDNIEYSSQRPQRDREALAEQIPA
jgi:CheY-like chemotaxis protein/transcriptional regulator with XRE-family HTH domain